MYFHQILYTYNSACKTLKNAILSLAFNHTWRPVCANSQGRYKEDDNKRRSRKNKTGSRRTCIWNFSRPSHKLMLFYEWQEVTHLLEAMRWMILSNTLVFFYLHTHTQKHKHYPLTPFNARILSSFQSLWAFCPS